MMSLKAKKSIYCINVCKAWCCKNIIVDFDVKENCKPIDDEMFFKLRGITVDRKHSCLIVPCKCKWLNNRNKCQLYSWRPESCKSFECDTLKTQFGSNTS